MFDEVPEDLPNCRQYYVEIDGQESEGEGLQTEYNLYNDDDIEATDMEEATDREAFSQVLELPQVKLPPLPKTLVEPEIDYQQSILLT